ncbi:MAG: LamG-like jellyroll fold domain-containing protein [Armatimonadota bacterium]
MRMLPLLLLLMSTGILLAAPRPVKFFVAVAGSDTHAGTASRPFATLARAQQAVRGKIAGGLKAPVTVHIGTGTYQLPVPLAFGPEDTGTGEFPVTYAADPGTTVVISGGRRISGWKRGEGDCWAADVPSVKNGGWYFRQLFIDGRRVMRARTPNAEEVPPYWQIRGDNPTPDLARLTLTFAPQLVADWQQAGDAEIVAFGSWETFRRRLQSTHHATNSIELAPPFIAKEKYPWSYPTANTWCYLENAREFLDQPGEWYLDRQRGQLTYQALPGEDLTRASVMAPVLSKLIEVAGTPDKPVRNLHFRGLQFAFTDWALPRGGYQGIQANHYREATGLRISAAIQFMHAESCSVEDGVLTQLGGVGVEIGQGCKSVVIQGNRFEDIGATGVMVGGPNDEKLSPKEISVTNNLIRRCAIDYQGGVGVWVGFAEGARVEHNTLHHLPYTGISVGWAWGSQPTACKRNSISYNHIHHVTQRLADGGGIYTLGYQPDTVLCGNLIHDVERSRYAQGAPNNGIFLDEGSKGFLIEDNTIYNTTGDPVRHNQNPADWHTWGKITLLSEPLPSEPGKIGLGLVCRDGSRQVVPHAPALEPEQLTLEAWIYTTEIPTGGENRRWIASKNANEWEDGHYALIIANDRAGAYLNIGGGPANAFLAASAPGLIKPNQWHHLAMMYDGVTLTIYCDGAAVGKREIAKKRSAGSGIFCLGARPDNHVAFTGNIDEVRLYNRPLTAEAIKARFTHPTAKPPDGVAGYWGFDDRNDSVQQTIRQARMKAGIDGAYCERLLDQEENAQMGN